ncbi:SMP-30/gluconolactonase/LRE family protein [Candidatus Sumerlaeota bacterium]|nr:SMP-30/gluconolactonase/LRE family protein [Candidatus Sumerlaeota bacterium]
MKSKIASCVVCLFSLSLVHAQPTTAEPTKPKDAVMTDVIWKTVADQDLKFPEGPAWDGKQALYFSNCHGGFISRVTGAGTEVWLRAQEDPFLFTKTNGMTFGRDGALYACDFGRKAILRFNVEEKSSAIHAELTDGKKLNGPNDLAFDAGGNLYFSDPGKYSRTERNGGVYRIAAETKQLQLMKDDLGFPNGLCFTKDGKTLFLAESAFERVLKIAVSEDGSLGATTVFAEMPGGDPDGMAMDVEGNLWVAHFGGHAIRVYAPDGTLLKKINAPGKKPSNLEFAGADMKTLYITEDEFNRVHSTRVEIAGERLHWSPP